MRRGEVISTWQAGGVTADQLSLEMVGERTPLLRHPPPRAAAAGDRLVHLERVSTTEQRGVVGLHELRFDVFGGEVLGVAGVAGNGQRELARVLAGLDRPARGTVMLDTNGVAYIPEDRLIDGIASELTVVDNSIVRAYGRLASTWLRWLGRATVRSFTDSVLRAFEVSPARGDVIAGSLSGGNQQRLVLGRELAERCRVIVAHNPTRGLDVRAAEDVRRRLSDARAAGAGIVLITPDLDELLELSDRVAVLYHGRIVCLLGREQATKERLGALISGVGLEVERA
jgi:simple sugar transport system ATP-binding protein